LDLCFSSSVKESVSGIGGSGSVYIHKVVIDVEHGTYRVLADVGFGQFNFHGFSCILGQKDFFEKCDVLFQRRKETIELLIP